MVSFSLSPNTDLASVAIKVKDFDKMLNFYQDVVGLDLINEENDMAILGIKSKKKKLLGLIANPEGKDGSNTHAGLYHTTFVLPTQNDLALFMKQLMAINYPIEGTSDHGYCKSIYINDPENNRLEFSWDKPKKSWPLTDGKIDGVTKELDLPRFLGSSEGTYDRIPRDSKMGHVHLSVADLDESYDFYVNSLGFSIKDDDFVQTHFLSVNDYHHQIGLNQWRPSGTYLVEEYDLGVDHITFSIPTMDDLLALKDNLNNTNKKFYFNKGKQIIGIYDPSGIQLWFIVFKK